MTDARKPDTCVIVSPHGRKLEVPFAIFKAIEELLQEKATGRLEIDYRMGGVAGVRVSKVIK